MRVANFWLDRLGLIAIASVCSGYVVFASSFAELRLTFSFLNFPVFVGEILLFYCLALFFSKLCRRELSFRREHWVFVAYAFFVLAKAFYGYWVWGPLAFRDAAFLYYPFFAILSYTFWEPEAWGIIARRVCYAVLIMLMAMRTFHYFWPMSLIILAVILAWREKGRLRILFIIGILLVFPYHRLFPDIRAVVLASIVTLAYIILMIALSIRVSHRVRIVLAVLGFLFASVIVIKMTNSEIWHALDAKAILQNAQPPAEPLPEMPRPQGVHLFNPDGNTPDKGNSFNAFIVEVTSQVSGGHKARIPRIVRYFEGRTSDGAPADMFTTPAVTPDTLETPAVVNSQRQPLSDSGTFCQDRDNTLFRFYIWRDMAIEFWHKKPLFGFTLGRPLRSPTMRHYGISTSENEDGWLGAHNSYLYMIYRGGIIGLALVISLFVFWFQSVRTFFLNKNWEGILLCAILLNWMVSAGFFLVWELPYLAIPMWALFGITAKQWVLSKKPSVTQKYA